MGLQNLLYCNNEWVNWADFLHDDSDSEKLKIGCGQKQAWNSKFLHGHTY